MINKINGGRNLFTAAVISRHNAFFPTKYGRLEGWKFVRTAVLVKLPSSQIFRILNAFKISSTNNIVSVYDCGREKVPSTVMFVKDFVKFWWKGVTGDSVLIDFLPILWLTMVIVSNQGWHKVERFEISPIDNGIPEQLCWSVGGGVVMRRVDNITHCLSISHNSGATAERCLWHPMVCAWSAN